MDGDLSGGMKRSALVLVAASLLSTLAFASSPKKVALPVGHSMTMAMPAAVTGVRVNDPALVEVKRQGRKVTLVALAQGSTEATVTTAEGSHRFRVYVAADKYAMPH
jgi:Flp pilus assembly secretin CpaC